MWWLAPLVMRWFPGLACLRLCRLPLGLCLLLSLAASEFTDIITNVPCSPWPARKPREDVPVCYQRGPWEASGEKREAQCSHHNSLASKEWRVGPHIWTLKNNHARNFASKWKCPFYTEVTQAFFSDVGAALLVRSSYQLNKCFTQ